MKPILYVMTLLCYVAEIRYLFLHTQSSAWALCVVMLSAAVSAWVAASRHVLKGSDFGNGAASLVGMLWWMVFCVSWAYDWPSYSNQLLIVWAMLLGSYRAAERIGWLAPLVRREVKQ